MSSAVRLLPLTVLLVSLSAIAIAQDGTSTESTYMEPDPDLIRIVDTPWPPSVSISPDYRWMLLRTSLRNPPISELAQPELKLAGMRFRPQNSAPSRSRRYVALELVRLSDLEHIAIEGLPDGMRVLRTTWSPDGSMIAFTLETDTGVELWVIEVEEGAARNLTGPVVSLTANVWPKWLSNSETILFCMVPEGRGEPPEEFPVPRGPRIQETSGEEAPVRTYQDLLETPYDEDLFEYYLTSQLAEVGLSGNVSTITEPGILWDFDPSPNGEFVLVFWLHRPFSHSVTAGRFPELVEVIDLTGKQIFIVADLPARDRIPIAIGSVAEGPRSVTWRNDANATLCWAEALDGGDAGVEAEIRDRIVTLDAPFRSEPAELMLTELRFGGISWSSESLAIVSEWWWPSRQTRAWRVRPGDTAIAPELLQDYSWEDRYSDPGSLVFRKDPRGRFVIMTCDGGKTVFLSGAGASPEGDRPFMDRFDLNTLETERLFHSEPPFFERPAGFIDSDGRKLLFSRESVTEYPDYFVRDLSDGSEIKLTSFENPAPEFIGLQKELITYEREDGITLSATLYLPPGYDPSDGPLPLLMWAYPDEFVSADAAGQVSGSPYRYDYIGWWSPLIWLTRGYAVLSDPSMPIVAAEEGQPNDRFVEQLVMSAEAAVEEVVGRGVADPDRIAVGGHSYGAFLTANLLAHTDLFAAGIAMTGAYNRTLTPFGFQSEDRSLWEAPDVYWEVSPFMQADHIEEPILLIHGDADNNSGTFPMQSERFFAALNGLGGTARLVMLPLESHGYRARESILHVIWEVQQWIEKYVKNRLI